MAVAAWGHHGVATLGVAGLEGPGAPVETSSSQTLPEGRWLYYMKIDHASMEKGRLDSTEVEGDQNTFSMYGVGYGATPWLSGYLFLPYHAKMQERGGGTAGFADLSVMGVVGFKYDGGLKLVPANESLDDLEDWHFTLYLGTSIPTGDATLRDGNNQPIDPGMQLSFGKPSYSTGLTATKQLSQTVTAVTELSWITFTPYEFEGGEEVKFGDESRLNEALVIRMDTDARTKRRIDGNLELQYLSLGRDETDGVGDLATGGAMVYALIGSRVYLESSSFALGIKRPIWRDLNEQADQQGAEGTEDYRVVFSFSTLF